MAGLEPMPGHIDDIAVDKPQPVGSVLKDVAHGCWLDGARRAMYCSSGFFERSDKT